MRCVYPRCLSAATANAFYAIDLCDDHLFERHAYSVYGRGVRNPDDPEQLARWWEEESEGDAVTADPEMYPHVAVYR